MTNLHLLILIAADCGNEFCVGSSVGSSAYKQFINELFNLKMLEFDSKTKNIDYKLSDKGKFWLEHIKNIELPIEVRKWIIPT